MSTRPTPIQRSTVIEARSCAAYDYNNDSNNNDSSITSTTQEETTSSSSSSSSSVIDKDAIASRGIRDNVTRDQVAEEIQSFLERPLAVQDELRMIWTITMFLTILPVPTSVDLHPGFLMKGMVYFPVIGSLIGGSVATVFDFVDSTCGLPSAIAAAVGTAWGWYWTGCFHEDGLADSADGIGGGWTRAQIFKIMTDSRVGTYGCAVLALYTCTKVHLLAALSHSNWDNLYHCHGAGPACIVSHTLARVTAPYLIRSFDYVDDEQGPKSSFYAFMIQAKHLVSLPRKLTAIGYGFGVATLLYGPIVAAGLMGTTIIFAQVAGNYGNRKLGGVMGDFLGATICVCELLLLGILIMVQNEQQQQQQGWTAIGALWETFLENGTGAVASIQLEKIQQLLQNDRVVALIRFLACVGFLEIWRIAVHHCSGENRITNETTTTSTGSDKLTNGTTETTEASCENGATTPKGEASRILSLSTSSFRERYDAVQAYMDALAKPVGSLGTLETWASRLAALQRTLKPDAQNVICLIFAGDHGVAAAPEDGGEGCSAYPQAVTQAVLVGLERGVAGASVLARANNVKLRVVDVGVVLGDSNPFKDGQNVTSSSNKLPKGTRNFCNEPAMTAEECQRCMNTGRDALIRYTEETASRVVLLGEVGIGNTTSSSALIAALTQKSTEELVGGGAFAAREISEAVVSKKIDIVKRALTKHYSGNKSIQAADALARLGGAEIAAIVGALLEASDRDIAVLVDGFIATAAALVAACISPNVCHVLFFTSHSAEPGQRAAIERIQSISEEHNIPADDCPVLAMHLRMGEGTAALIAVPILRSSAEVLSNMATIQDILS